MISAKTTLPWKSLGAPLVAQTVDYEKIAETAVRAMKTDDLNRFLVVCALVSDLYCPSYNPRQPLEKDSNLARAAAR